MSRGFTLLEVVIYIALVGLLMTGAVLTSYTLLSAAGATSADATTLDEAQFVMRKLDWILRTATSVATPSAVTPHSQTLSVACCGGEDVKMRLVANTIEMSEDGGAIYEPLTSPNVSVTNLQFQYLANPAGLAFAMTLNSSTYTYETYFH